MSSLRVLVPTAALAIIAAITSCGSQDATAPLATTLATVSAAPTASPESIVGGLPAENDPKGYNFQGPKPSSTTSIPSDPQFDSVRRAGPLHVWSAGLLKFWAKADFNKQPQPLMFQSVTTPGTPVLCVPLTGRLTIRMISGSTEGEVALGNSHPPFRSSLDRKHRVYCVSAK